MTGKLASPSLLNFSLLLAAFLIFILIYWFRNLPLFWDITGQVDAALRLQKTGFSYLFPSETGVKWQTDNGHLPLYAIYLACLFNFFGVKLWVVHFSVLPFAAGCVYLVAKMNSKILEHTSPFAIATALILYPFVLAQIIFASSEFSLAFFTLWMLHAVQNNRALHIVLASIVVCLLNLRGIAITILALTFYIAWRKNKNGWYLVPSILIWMLWIAIHRKFTGNFWGEENQEFRDFPGMAKILHNTAAALLKFLESGAFICWAFFCYSVFKRRKWDDRANFLVLVSLSVLLVCIPSSNPVVSRYYLIVHLLLVPTVFYILPETRKLKKGIVIAGLFILFLASNIFILPPRFSNPWDCSLSALKYFPLRDSLDNYVEKEKIAPNQIQAGYQLYFPDSLYRLKNEFKGYALLPDHRLPESEYVAESNICNNFNRERETFLTKSYHLVKSFENGPIFINLYQRNK